MGRRRVKNKRIPMSLSISHDLVMRVDKELSYKQSRSKWVEGAIKAKLDAYEDEHQIITNLTSKQLITILHNRQIISLGMWETLRDVIKATSPIEEIGE